jgi:hypothetical protein
MVELQRIGKSNLRFFLCHEDVNSEADPLGNTKKWRKTFLCKCV